MSTTKQGHEQRYSIQGNHQYMQHKRHETLHRHDLANTFKERFRNHIKSFNHKKYSNETELSKYVWHLKENNTDYTIKLSIIKNSISYTGG